MVNKRRAAAVAGLVLVAAVVLAACGNSGNSSGTDAGRTLRDNGQLMAGSGQTMRDGGQAMMTNGQTTQANGRKMVDAGKAMMAKGQAVHDDDMARLGHAVAAPRRPCSVPVADLQLAVTVERAVWQMWEWRRSRIKSCRPRSTCQLGRAPQFPPGFLRAASESAPVGRWAALLRSEAGPSHARSLRVTRPR